MAKKRGGKKIRVDFRTNRQAPRRSGDLTRRYDSEAQSPDIEDAALQSHVRARGELSRKRTIVVDDENVPFVDEALWRSGTVTAVRGGECTVRDDAARNWRCTIRRILRTLQIDERAPVVAGDRVWISDQTQHGGPDTGVIERVGPRRTLLSRSDFRGREHAIVANADQLLIVASVAQPNAKPHLIDRYLVAAGKGDLRPVICFNKADLLTGALRFDQDDDTEAAHLDDLMCEYRALGYECLACSAASNLGIDELRSMLAERISVVAGQSGVGKSSLCNALQPGLQLKVAEVSADNQKGRHTTSYTELLPLMSGGFLVDTPGIRQFTLWNIEPGELEAYFIEFRPLIAKCRFKDCHHLAEAGCAVAAAAEDGAISARRYASYCKLLEELAQERRER